VIALATPLRAAENAYDVFGKAIAPFVALFSKEAANRALKADLRIVDAAKLHPALAGQTAHLSVESPDKLLLRAPVLGREITVCRNDQDIWAAPGSAVEAILAEVDLPKPPKKYKLGKFELPISEKQLVFLPALFQVTDEGVAMVDAQSCRVLHVKLMRELAHSLGVEEWAARVWVRPDYKPAKLELEGPKGGAVLAFDKLEFSQSLSPQTWAPAPDQTDVTHLKPARYKQLLDAVVESVGRAKSMQQ
jgi:hypothetical protein